MRLRDLCGDLFDDKSDRAKMRLGFYDGLFPGRKRKQPPEDKVPESYYYYLVGFGMGKGVQLASGAATVALAGLKSYYGL